MTHEAILELAVRARDYTAATMTEVGGNLDKMAGKASAAASKVGSAFSGMGSALANGIGNAVETISSGGSLTQAFAGLGVYMAGQLAEQFAGSAIEKLAGSSVIAAITAPIAALGSTIGSVLTAAIPAGMALAPVLIIGAIAAAIALLIANPDIRNKVIGFAQGLVGNLVDALTRFLGVLPQVLGKAFEAAWSFVTKTLLPFVLEIVKLYLSIPGRLIGLGASILGAIVGGLTSLPGRLADIIGGAFRSLRVDIGPFHIRGGGITIDLPKINLPSIDIPHFAEGVRGFPGGLAVVGERGPELVRLPRGSDVIPNAGGASMPGVFIQGVSEADIVDMVDRGLYFRLQRSAPSRGRY